MIDYKRNMKIPIFNWINMVYTFPTINLVMSHFLMYLRLVSNKFAKTYIILILVISTTHKLFSKVTTCNKLIKKIFFLLKVRIRKKYLFLVNKENNKLLHYEKLSQQHIID